MYLTCLRVYVFLHQNVNGELTNERAVQIHLYRGQLSGDNVSVYVVKGIVYMAEGRPFSEVCFPMRVRHNTSMAPFSGPVVVVLIRSRCPREQLLHALAVPRVIMVGRSASCSPDLDRGDFLLVNDHINFSGRNPLFGPNEER